MNAKYFFQFLITLSFALHSLEARSEESLDLKKCRDAYLDFLKSDNRFSGPAAEVVKTCKQTLGAAAQKKLAAELIECSQTNSSLTLDGDRDSGASSRRYKCSAEKAYQLAIEKKQRRVEFMEDCLKSGKTRTQCLDILVGELSSPKQKTIVEASLLATDVVEPGAR